MERRGIIHGLVMDEVANLYELAETIADDVCAQASEYGFVVDADEILSVLDELVQKDWVARYRLSSGGASVVPECERPIIGPDYYFLLTEKGHANLRDYPAPGGGSW